ncbi:hypothetical protein CHUAL_006156 [Chamberlinius hualienensis]
MLWRLLRPSDDEINVKPKDENIKNNRMVLGSAKVTNVSTYTRERAQWFWFKEAFYSQDIKDHKGHGAIMLTVTEN